MNILYHHRTQAEDGQAVHIRSLVRAFEGLGHAVRELALVEKTGRADPAKGEASAPDGAEGEGHAFPWSLVGRVPRFAREVAEYAYTVPAARRLRAAIAEARPDFIYERYAFGNAAGVKVARSEGIPLVLEVNSPMALELSRTRGLSFPRHARRFEASVFKGADRVAVVTRVLGDMLVDLGVDPARIFVTPNGVHLDQFASPDREAARAELGIGHVDGPVLGFTGYYRDWHRLDLVIDGMKDDAALGEAHLVLVGMGPVEEELRDRALRQGVGERVHFAGTRPHHRIPAILPAFDVGLVPAINPYASPLKLHEDMAAGVVPVAPDQPNLREVLTDGEDSLLFPPGDGAALNLALGRLAAEASLRETLGAAARSAVAARDLTWEANARRVVSEVELIDK